LVELGAVEGVEATAVLSDWVLEMEEVEDAVDVGSRSDWSCEGLINAKVSMS
jgi:hypothetical protein